VVLKTAPDPAPKLVMGGGIVFRVSNRIKGQLDSHDYFLSLKSCFGVTTPVSKPYHFNPPHARVD